MAFAIESASILMKVLKKDNIVCIDDYETEKKEKEIDDTNKMDEVLFCELNQKINFNHFKFNQLRQISFHNLNTNFSTSDFSLVIYSPPEIG
ncbi:MAG TPA: hypothetical protein PLU17_09165 [Chitinophagaceae bacterium]|nr:hypothetical protein [Chitinophagaceae bacterium]